MRARPLNPYPAPDRRVTYDCCLCERWAVRAPEAPAPACCNTTMNRRPELPRK